MIHAKDALRLPGAQLNEEQLAKVRKLLGEIDKVVREKMTRNGAVFSTNNTDPQVQFEVNFQLQSEFGWDVQVQPKIVEGLDRRPRHAGYDLTLIPSLTATRAAREPQA